MKVCAYLRVSTGRQAERDLSIPDQQKQIEIHCDKDGDELVRVFVEAGASAMDENRPVFQEMIDWVTGPDHPVDAIVVHSYSRFFRDAFLAEFYIRRLAKAGVRLDSVTQETGTDSTGELIRKIIALFDEYSSREKAKHVLRSMKRNAALGYWNGSVPPFGYRTVEVGKKGDKAKKVLEIEPDEAAVVRKMYDLYLHGDDQRPSYGVKAIVSYLNANGVRQRGRKFSLAIVHRILTSQTYAGKHYFNRTNSRTNQNKPVSEWVAVGVPAVIGDEQFNLIQGLLKARNPKKAAPRTVSGPTLLAGIARCRHCGESMLLRTGKSGRYRYYTCTRQARYGKTACRGESIRLDQLDRDATNLLVTDLCRAEWIRNCISRWMAASDLEGRDRGNRLKRLQEEIEMAEAALGRLYAAIEAGTIDTDDPILRERVAGLKLKRDEAASFVRMLDHRDGSEGLVDMAKIDRFVQTAPTILRSDNDPRRRGLVQLLVRKAVLAEGNLALSGDPADLAKAVAACREKGPYVVPSFVREWRTRRDSNSRPLPSEGSALSS
jgi:site-specific DNA recombinase